MVQYSVPTFASWPLALLLTISPTLLHATAPFRVPYETERTFGYDGPWNAVKVAVGTPPQPMHLYPGGPWGCIIWNTTVCDLHPDFCPAKEELFNPALSKSRDRDPAHNTPGGFDGTAYGRTLTMTHYFDDLTVGEGRGSYKLEHASLALNGKAKYEYPGGIVAPPVLGRFSLGAIDDEQHYPDSRGNDSSGRILVNRLEIDKKTASRTFSLHIGAAGLGQQGSLVLGGYEKGRMVHPPGRYPWDKDLRSLRLPIEMANVTIRELNPKSRDRDEDLVLKAPEGFIDGTLSAVVDPDFPYLYLPKSLCSSLASALPMHFDDDLGLYIWDEIPKKPYYLEFVLTHPEAFPKFTSIRVPLPLLTLTLSRPLALTPTKYFPCRPHTQAENEPYALGMAFLQAAVLTVHWQTELYWIGQAIGPGKKGIVDQKGAMFEINGEEDGILASMASEGSGIWEASWEGIWGDVETSDDPAPVGAGNEGTQVSESGDMKKGSSKKLATGAIVGIAIGAVILLVLILGGILLCLRRRTIRQDLTPTTEPDSAHRITDVKLAQDPEQNGLPLFAGQAEMGTATTPNDNGPFQFPDDTSRAPVQLEAIPAGTFRRDSQTSPSSYSPTTIRRKPVELDSRHISPHSNLDPVATATYKERLLAAEDLDSHTPSPSTTVNPSGPPQSFAPLPPTTPTAPIRVSELSPKSDKHNSTAPTVSDGFYYRPDGDGAGDTVSGWGTLRGGEETYSSQDNGVGSNVFSFEQAASNRFPFGVPEGTFMTEGSETNWRG